MKRPLTLPDAQADIEAEINRKYDEMMEHTPCWYAMLDDDLVYDEDPEVVRRRVREMRNTYDVLVQFAAHPPPYQRHVHYS